LDFQFSFKNIAMTFAAFLIVAVFTAWLSGIVKGWAEKKGYLAIPNERSSHDKPVPSVGGISIVFTVLAGYLIFALNFEQNIPWFWILFVSALMIAVIGLFDDIFVIKKRIRFFIHLSAAGIVIFWIGSKLQIIFPEALQLTGPISITLVVLYVVWNINLYNFMDGIDGLASGHAVFMGIVAGTIAWVNGNFPLALAYYLLGAASLGFLKLNWHPAKIFMGDLCSGFMGITMAVLGLWGKMTSTVPLTAFLILMAIFYVDPTYTIIRRSMAGENPTTTHRDFAFHHAIRRGLSHSKVTGIILLIDFLWLAPLAIWTVILRSKLSIPVLFLAYIPIIALAIYLKAGQRLNDGQDPDYIAKQKQKS